MRDCPGCGRPNPADARFCNGCGAPFPESAPAQEQRKTVTILFADVTGSTGLGERLDPESLRRVLARFFAAAREVVESHGGTVEKFIGDAVMAVFGVPVLHEDDALRATRAAAGVQDAVARLNVELHREYDTTLQVRIGLNTGEVVTGTAERLATGDAVNIAARLEQHAGPGEVLLGEQTMRLVGAAVDAEPVPPMDMKGKSEPVAAYRLRAVTAAVSRSRPHSAPMVGRASQLRLLEDAFTHVTRERACSLFTVLGTAGVGKSRLAEEFLAVVPATVVTGRCLSYGEGITYWPVVEVVTALTNSDGTRDEVAAVLADDPAVAVAIDALLGRASVATSSTDIAWAVRKLLERVAAVRPLVLVFDDMHWAEPTFLDLVEHVTDLSRDAPILLLCLARPELLDRRPTWGGGKLNATTVLLEPLDAAETTELVDALAPDGLDPRARQRVRDAAAGNPLFAEEMLALLVAGDGADVRVPPTIQALLAARLDQLDAAERRVLERGSVEGQSFHRGAVADLTPEEGDLPARLVGLVRKDLVRPDRATIKGDDAFRFRHLLIRDAAYDGLPKSARAELHERFARWLESHDAELVERDEIVGYHLERAYRYWTELGPEDEAARALAVAAADRLDKAGQRAMDRGDMGAAVVLMERAGALSVGHQRAVEHELALATALMFCGRPADAVDRLDALVARAAASGDRVAELRAGLVRGEVLMNIDPEGRYEEQEVLIEEARPLFESAADDAALATLYRSDAHVANFGCQNSRFLHSSLKSIEYAHRSGQAPLERSGWIMAASAVVFGPTPVADGLRWFDEAKQKTPLFDQSFDLYRAALLALLGRFDEARELAARAEQEITDRGMTTLAAISNQLTWELEEVAGDHVAAERLARAGCEALEAMGDRSWLSTQLAQWAKSLYELGRYEEAERCAVRGLELGATSDVATDLIASSVLVKEAARRGDRVATLALVDRIAAMTARIDHPVAQGEAASETAAALAMLGETARARLLLQEAVGHYARKGAVVLVDRARRRLAELDAPG